MRLLEREPLLRELHSWLGEARSGQGRVPEAIRASAERNGLPVESIAEVSVLDPYFYH